ncbi:MAG: helix-turn-helix transcriptional regulator [Acidobacteriota bacterium]|nr:helix-turn-helix transcriptional regulator [Acidobacteriota bacterium]
MSGGSQHPARAVRELLRERRVLLGLTQAEAARRASGDRRIQQQFVANLESRGIPSTARKVISYAMSLGIDLAEFQALAGMDLRWSDHLVGLDWSQVQENITAAFTAGDVRQAIGMTYAALERARAERNALQEGRHLWLLGIFLDQGDRPWLARTFFEKALQTGAFEGLERNKLLCALAKIHAELALPEIAMAIIGMVDETVHEPGSLDELFYLSTRSTLEFIAGRFDQAVEIDSVIDQRLNELHDELTGGDGEYPAEIYDWAWGQQARFLRALAWTGDLGRAAGVARRLEARREEVPERRARFLLALGEYSLAADRLFAADRQFTEALDLSRQIDDRDWIFLAKLGQARVAQRQGRTALVRELYRDLRRHERDRPRKPYQRSLLEQLAAGIEKTRGTP